MINPHEESKRIKEILNNGTANHPEEAPDFMDCDETEKFAIETDGNDTDRVEPLPPPLRMLQIKQVFVAVGLAVFAICAAIALREVKFLSVLTLCLCFLGMAFMIQYDWEKGKIDQRVVACTHVIKRIKTTRIICRDTQCVYEYILPDKKDDIVEGYTYIIWTRKSNPKAIMAYQPL